MSKVDQMKSLNAELVRASEAYYTNSPLMSDKEFDDKLDELKKLEDETGVVLSDSVVHNVGYNINSTVSALETTVHEEPAKSLSKTKDINELANWLDKNIGCLSWKMDGLTLVLTYDNGSLAMAATRGNGVKGNIVTHLAQYIKGIPNKIPYKQHLVVRGEAVISYSAFKSMKENGAEFKNPRNLVSGTMASLDGKLAKERHVEFKAFEMVTPDMTGVFKDNLDKLSEFGFAVVDHTRVTKDTLTQVVTKYTNAVKTFDYPVDGLVLQYDDVKYSKSLGMTDKFPRGGKAFKWADDTARTVIKQIIWQPSRTGRVNPVAVFDTVELEGASINRATCNNISYMKAQNITEGAVVEVYRANMVIPTIGKVVQPTGKPLMIPNVCPACGGALVIDNSTGTEFLMCTNPNCFAKDLKHLSHFVSKDAMDIDGLSEKSLEDLINNGFVKNYYSLYTLQNNPEIAKLAGWGQKSYEKLLSAVQASRQTTLARYLYAFGIENIGRRVSADIAKKCEGSVQKFVQAMDARYDWRSIEGVGEILTTSLYEWWSDAGNRKMFIELAKLMQFQAMNKPVANINNTANGINGKTFCITGAVYIFKNRNEAGAYIESKGGKLASSVTSKTDYLVTNDTTSGSSKNKKAQELGKPILTEQQLIDLGGGM